MVSDIDQLFQIMCIFGTRIIEIYVVYVSSYVWAQVLQMSGKLNKNIKIFLIKHFSAQVNASLTLVEQYASSLFGS